MLLGVGGSGRQSLSRLSAFIVGLPAFQIEVNKGYNFMKWREDIKGLIYSTIALNKSQAFIFNDTQIINEATVEDINCLLTSGQVFGLPFNPDELKNIDDVVRKECIVKNLVPNKVNLVSVMVNRVKKNLHIVFAMSPLSKKFAARLRMFPALVNNCSINWMTEWPEEALRGVALQQLQDIDILQQNQNTSLEQISEMMKEMHQSTQKLSDEMFKTLRRVNYLTPKSFLELLGNYKKILVKKQQELGQSLDRLEEGMNKLMNANEQVVSLQEKLKQQEPLLKEAQAEVQELLERIRIDKAAEIETKKIVAKEEAEATTQQIEANTLKMQAEESVKEANEELDESLKKISLLKPNNITEVKNFTNPPQKVKVVNAAMCILILDEKLIKKGADLDEYWKQGKNNLLSDANKLFLLLTDPAIKNNISGQRIAKVKKLIEQHISVWVDKEIMGANVAIFYIYLWVKSMISYYDINEKSKPIRDELQKLTTDLEEKNAVLNEKKALLDASVKKLKELEDLFDEKISFKEDLERQVKECTLKVGRASTLTTLLADEKERWKMEIEKLKDQIQCLPSDALLVAGMVAYCGPFVMTFRKKMETKFKGKLNKLGIQFNQQVSLQSFLSNPLEIMRWNMFGLPKDETSIQNGIILTNSNRWALMIDPQKRANKFLKEFGKDFRIKSIKASSNVIQAVETEVQFGSWLLIENVGEEIDSSWDVILSPKIVSTGGIKEISLGEKTCQYNDTFQFFMTTTLTNPVFSPETSAKVSIINFGITLRGLEEQLIAQIMMNENQELEKLREEIVKKNADETKKLKEVEDNILVSLKNSSVDILMDENLIRKLDESKKTSQQINEQLKISAETEQNINQIRENYRDLAFHSATLFFVISSLSEIDSMYQYSLFWFESIFSLSLLNSEKNSSIDLRIQNIKSHFTYALYKNVCQSLFEEHKLILSFLIAAKLQEGYEKLDQEKFKLFLLGSDMQKSIPNKPYSQIQDEEWPVIYSEIKAISDFHQNGLVVQNFLEQIENWKKVLEGKGTGEEIPSIENIQWDQLDRLILIKTLRRDKLIEEIQGFISKILGDKFVEVPVFKLDEVFQFSDCATALLFVISAGSDPKADFDALAAQKEIKNVQSISLGQGQEIRTAKMIREMKKNTGNGGWVLLQNCHLLESWMPELEMICEELSPETVHKDFRLWLTSMPSKAFPVSILQNSLKVTIEPPSGLKANLKQSYMNISDQELQSCVQKPAQFRKLLFGLCFFHAVVQERKKFGPIGWNIPYEFTNEDLHVSKKQLRIFLDEYNEIPFKVLNFICASINYGGRVTDDKDELLIKSILKNFLNSEVLKDDFAFCPDKRYYSVNSSTQLGYINYIESLPLNTAPNVFGLHNNAEITTNQNRSTEFIKTVLKCNNSGSQGAVVDSEAFQIIDQLRKNLHSEFDLDQIRVSFPTLYQESLNTVLLQETEKYNTLLKQIDSHLISLLKALKGLVVFNEELEKVMDSLSRKQVPEAWSGIFLSMKPLFSWFEDLNQRCLFFQNWITTGAPNIFWFSGFSFPQAFITGVMQNYARSKQLEIDLISFDYLFLDQNVNKDTLEKPKSGVYIEGLFIEGAQWDYQSTEIIDPKPKELFSKLPIIHLKPTENPIIQEDVYKCPLYKVVSRKGTLSTTGHSTNFIMKLSLPTKQNSDYWIKGGVAAFLSLHY